MFISNTITYRIKKIIKKIQLQHKYTKACFPFGGGFSSVQFSCSVVSDSLRPHGPQNVKPPCPSPTLGVYSNSSPWVGDALQPSHLLSSPSPLAFNLSQHEVAKVIGVSVSISVLPMNIQDWFPLWWTDWICLQSKKLSRVFSNITVQKHSFFGAQLSL